LATRAVFNFTAIDLVTRLDKILNFNQSAIMCTINNIYLLFCLLKHMREQSLCQVQVCHKALFISKMPCVYVYFFSVLVN